MEVISPWHTLGGGGSQEEKFPKDLPPNSPWSTHVCVCMWGGVLYVNTNVCIWVWVHEHMFVIMDRNQGQGGMHHFPHHFPPYIFRQAVLLNWNSYWLSWLVKVLQGTTCSWPHPCRTGVTGFSWPRFLRGYWRATFRSSFSLDKNLTQSFPKPFSTYSLVRIVRAEKPASSLLFMKIYHLLKNCLSLNLPLHESKYLKRYLVDIISVWGPSSLITL